MDESKLPFGNVSNTVKIGDAVHRDTGPWTPAIHALLEYLHEHHFDYAPRVLGIDEKDREILSFLDGEAAVRPWPSVLFSNDGICQAARLLRQYHDIVSGFRPTINAEWRIGKIKLEPNQVILHGDLGPWNTIWQGEILTGLIDWDFAHPGERIEDLAQLAYYFIPLRGEDGWKKAGFKDRPDFGNRLRNLVDAYGMYSPAEVINELFNYLENDRQRVQKMANRGIKPWTDFVERGDIEESLEDTSWLKMMQSDLL